MCPATFFCLTAPHFAIHFFPIMISSSGIFTIKERYPYVKHHRIHQQRDQQFHLGSSCHDLHHRCRPLFKLWPALFADLQIPLRNPRDHRTHLPQAQCLRRCHDTVPGGLYGSGSDRRHRKYCRCSRRYRHRRTGRCLLDVGFRSPGHVHQIL